MREALPFERCFFRIARFSSESVQIFRNDRSRYVPFTVDGRKAHDFGLKEHFKLAYTTLSSLRLNDRDIALISSSQRVEIFYIFRPKAVVPCRFAVVQ